MTSSTAAAPGRPRRRALADPAAVFEHTRGTYGADDEPLEAVINLKPAEGAALISETYEGD